MTWRLDIDGISDFIVDIPSLEYKLPIDEKLIVSAPTLPARIRVFRAGEEMCEFEVMAAEWELAFRSFVQSDADDVQVPLLYAGDVFVARKTVDGIKVSVFDVNKRIHIPISFTIIEAACLHSQLRATILKAVIGINENLSDSNIPVALFESAPR